MPLTMSDLGRQYEEAVREADIRALEKALAQAENVETVMRLLLDFIAFPRVTEMVEKRLAALNA